MLRAGYTWVGSTQATAIYRQKPTSMVREKLLQHVRESERLLRRAYEPLAESALRTAGVGVESGEAPDLRQPAKHANRILRSAVVAMAGGDDEAAKSVIGELRPLSAVVVRSQGTVERAEFGGIRRAFGLQPSQARELTSAI